MTKHQVFALVAPFGIRLDSLKRYALLHEMGHFMGEQHPTGTAVWGYPYPNDPSYLEIVTPDGHALTVDEGIDVEALECPGHEPAANEPAGISTYCNGDCL